MYATVRACVCLLVSLQLLRVFVAFIIFFCFSLCPVLQRRLRRQRQQRRRRRRRQQNTFLLHSSYYSLHPCSFLAFSSLLLCFPSHLPFHCPLPRPCGLCCLLRPSASIFPTPLSTSLPPRPLPLSRLCPQLPVTIAIVIVIIVAIKSPAAPARLLPSILSNRCPVL